jgi:alkanesulfonate monooxygenase SsuD/methylene tetrahydromethanopterin reductase-like flavin-dependent oxidoreductase (luciferase family)
MRYGLDLPNFGDFSDIGLISEVAAGAEEAGWDGVFLWDHIARSTAFPPGLPFADVTVALTAIALATKTIKFGTLVTPLPRRRPHKVAREFTSLDHLSGGRVVLGVGIGSPPDSEFEAFGEHLDLRARGDLLDESIEVVTALWGGRRVDHDGQHLSVHTEAFAPRPLQQPRIPIWVGARWPSKGRPIRRAARWDGIVPTSADPDGSPHLTPGDIAAIRDRMGDDPGEIVVTSPREGEPEAYERAGATWLVEIVPDRETALARAAAGPPA